MSVKYSSNRHRFSEGLSLIHIDLVGNLCLLSVAPTDIDLARVFLTLSSLCLLSMAPIDTELAGNLCLLSGALTDIDLARV